jgi:hypothetical protein
MQEYDIVRLKKSLPDADIPIGSRGTIVMLYDGEPSAYEVEFLDADGNTLCDSKSDIPTFTTDDEHIEKVIL